MQKVEITNREHLEIYCPFCGTPILSEEGADQCEHILFMGFEDSLEYASPELKLNLNETSPDPTILSDAIDRKDVFKMVIHNHGETDEIICFSLDEVEMDGHNYQVAEWPDEE